MLTINGVNPTTYGVVAYSKIIQTAEVVNFEDWIRKAKKFTLLAQESRYKKITLKLLFRAANEQALEENKGTVLGLLRNCTLRFDNLSFYYDCIITGVSEPEIRSSKEHIVTVELKSGYAYKDYVVTTANGITSVNITNPGTESTYALVEVTPTAALSTLTIGSFTLSNLVISQLVSVDGELFKVLQGSTNRYNDFSGTFLLLNPGSNTISISSVYANITIKFKPKWI